MTFRNDTYIGNNHYWIRFHNGTHEVRKGCEVNYDDVEITTVFSGHYEKCVEFIRDIEVEYLESII